MRKDVAILDRKNDIENIRMSLNMVGIGVDYLSSDLLNETLNVLEKKQGNFSLDDGVEIERLWKIKWDKYFLQLEKEKENLK